MLILNQIYYTLKNDPTFRGCTSTPKIKREDIDGIFSLLCKLEGDKAFDYRFELYHYLVHYNYRIL